VVAKEDKILLPYNFVRFDTATGRYYDFWFGVDDPRTEFSGRESCGNSSVVLMSDGIILSNLRRRRSERPQVERSPASQLQLPDEGHVYQHSIPLRYPQFSQSSRQMGHLVEQFCVSDFFHGFSQGTVVDEGNFGPATRLHMSVDGVVARVQLSTRKPKKTVTFRCD
jgi:hypothetical protein